TVDARETDDSAAPAAHDETARIVTHRKREAAEEIASLDTHGVERNFVIHSRQIVRPRDSSHVTRIEDYLALFDPDRAVPCEVSHSPARESFAVEQWCRARNRPRGRRNN